MWIRMHFCVIKTALGLDCCAVMGDGALLNIQTGKALPYHQIITRGGKKEKQTVYSMLCVSIIMKPQAPQSDCITTKIAS